MIRWEAALVAVFGTVLGAGLGVTIGAIATMALPSTLVAGIAVPVQHVVVIGIVAITAAVLAASIPARRASRITILAALSLWALTDYAGSFDPHEDRRRQCRNPRQVCAAKGIREVRI